MDSYCEFYDKKAKSLRSKTYTDRKTLAATITKTGYANKGLLFALYDGKIGSTLEYLHGAGAEKIHKTVIDPEAVW